MNYKFTLAKGVTMMFTFCILLYSCCTQKDCVSAFDLKEIKLTGFTQNESGAVLVSSYMQGNAFTKLIDSASVPARTYSGTDTVALTIYVPIDFNPKSDYNIEFLKTGLSYKISEIKTSLNECNTCFLKADNYTQLSSYKVNGQLITKSSFEIVK